MKQHSRLVWITVLALGWLLDFLFWRQAPGLNFAIYVVLCLIGGFFLLRLEGTRLAPRAAFLLPLIGIFAAASFIRAEPMTQFLAVVLTLFLMGLLAITAVDGRWLEYDLGQYGLGFLRLAWSAVSRGFGFQRSMVAEASDSRTNRTPFWPVLRGLLLALPILLIFGALLGSADLVFRRELDSLIELFSLERLPEYIFRLVYILLAAWTLLGVFIHAATMSTSAPGLDNRLTTEARFLGFTEACIVLGSVAVLFAAFVLVQFRYFFGGSENIGLDGYTFAEYARRGYGELMTVAVLSLLLILALGAITRRESPARQRLFSALSVLIVALVGVMLVSAYQRLSLYEMAYGFTRLRTYVHVSLIWLGFLLAAVVVLEILRRERLFAPAALLAALGFALTITVLNVDAFIVRQNVGRALRGQGLDVPHLASLSTDSVPPLIDFFHADSTSEKTRDALGAALACRLEASPEPPPSDWRSFTVSRSKADLAMGTVRDELDSYRAVQQDWYTQIITPQGETHDCYAYWD
jgi:hypothetical protein